MRVLVVEDNGELSKLIVGRLAQSAISSDVASSVAEAEKAIARMEYAAILLDLGLPDMDGLEFLRRLRASGNSAPVLITTARDALEDRVRGLQEGADDYLPKPFALDELAARVQALLRRPGKLLGERLAAGNVTLNPENHEVRVDGRVVLIRLREAVVLEILLRHKGNVVPRRYFEDQLFGIEGEQETNTVDVYIHRVRRHLLDAGANVSIHTIRGIGYLFAEAKRVPKTS